MKSKRIDCSKAKLDPLKGDVCEWCGRPVRFTAQGTIVHRRGYRRIHDDPRSIKIVTEITLTLDRDDSRDINAAIATFQRINHEWQGAMLPASHATRGHGKSDLAASILAEICRDWLEHHGG